MDILVSEQNDIIEQEDLSALGEEAEIEKMQVSIDKHMETIEEYFDKVSDIRTKNMETFYAIDAILEPPPLVLRGVTEAESDLDPNLKLESATLNEEIKEGTEKIDNFPFDLCDFPPTVSYDLSLSDDNCTKKSYGFIQEKGLMRGQDYSWSRKGKLVIHGVL